MKNISLIEIGSIIVALWFVKGLVGVVSGYFYNRQFLKSPDISQANTEGHLVNRFAVEVGKILKIPKIMIKVDARVGGAMALNFFYQKSRIVVIHPRFVQDLNLGALNALVAHEISHLKDWDMEKNMASFLFNSLMVGILCVLGASYLLPLLSLKLSYLQALMVVCSVVGVYLGDFIAGLVFNFRSRLFEVKADFESAQLTGVSNYWGMAQYVAGKTFLTKESIWDTHPSWDHRIEQVCVLRNPEKDLVEEISIKSAA